MEERFLIAVAVGAAWGFISRLLLLRVDYRAYPSYPHAYAAHMAFGFLASLVGSVAPVAFATGQYDAVTFMLLVATQFREIRKMERDKLESLESIELVPRGANYVEGIAEVFEVRNYWIMAVGAITSGATVALGGLAGAGVGAILALLSLQLRRDLSLKDVAHIYHSELDFDGVELFVGDVHLMNIALPASRETILKWGMGLTIQPKKKEFRGVLDNMGQRQAIVHDLIHVLGNREDVDTPELKPAVRKNAETNALGVYFCPIDRDRQRIMKIAENVPVLSNARRGSGEGL